MANEVAILPVSSVTSVAKRSLAAINGQLTKDAKSTLSTAAAIFICYVTSTARDIAARRVKGDGAVNLNTRDIAAALDELDLSEFNEQINAALQAFRDEKTAKRAIKRPRVDAEEAEEQTGEGIHAETEMEVTDPLDAATAGLNVGAAMPDALEADESDDELAEEGSADEADPDAYGAADVYGAAGLDGEGEGGVVGGAGLAEDEAIADAPAEAAEE